MQPTRGQPAQCIEHFLRLDEAGRGWELSDTTRDELDTITETQGNRALYAKRSIILNNLYGVDIDDGAVEICKLRLWLSMVADIEDEPDEVEPLPNIDFNIRQGNSLIGFTEVVEVATDEGDAALTNFGGGAGESVQEMYDDIIEAIENHRQAATSKEAARWRNTAESRIKSYSEKLDEKILNEFHEAGAKGISLSDVQGFSPFHWVLEFATVYAGGGFDVLIGNPPWDQLRPSRDDFFPKYDERFRTRRPSEKDEIQSELLEDEETTRKWKEYQDNIEVQMRYFTDGPEYNLQTPEVAGRKDPNENNIAGLFVERVFDLVKEEGYVAQVLPGVIFNGSFSKDLRMKMLDNSEITSLIGFENKGVFDGIDDRFKFCVATFKNKGRTENLQGIFDQRELSILKNIETQAVTLSRDVLAEYSPEACIFPFVSSQQEVSVLSKLLEHPSVQTDVKDTWKIEPHREIHSARDADRFFENGDYPVYGGRNVHQFVYSDELSDAADAPEFWSVKETTNREKSARYRARERAFNSGNLKKAIYTEFDGPQTSKSQKQFVNDLLNEERGEPLSVDDVLLDCTEYRIVFRNITNSTNERTMLAAVIPKGIICHDKLITARPYENNPTEDDLSDIPLHSAYDRIFTNKELFAALGLLNSLQFDFIMRTKIDTTVVLYKFNESQMPRLTDGDEWFHYISQRAAQLNCYGEEFAEMRERLGGIEPATDEDERQRLQAEIDAAAFHAYGLDRPDTKFVLDDFYQVQDPRLMTEKYFDFVLEKYDELDESGPHP